MLCAPGSISACKFKCEAYVLTKDEGGRHPPFLWAIVTILFPDPDVTSSVNANVPGVNAW